MVGEQSASYIYFLYPVVHHLSIEEGNYICCRVSTLNYELELWVNFAFEVLFSADLDHFGADHRIEPSQAIVLEHDFNQFFSKFPRGKNREGDCHHKVLEFVELEVIFVDFENFLQHVIPDLQFMIEVHDHATDQGLGIGVVTLDDDVIEGFTEDQVTIFAVEGYML